MRCAFLIIQSIYLIKILVSTSQKNNHVSAKNADMWLFFKQIDVSVGVYKHGVVGVVHNKSKWRV